MPPVGFFRPPLLGFVHALPSTSLGRPLPCRCCHLHFGSGDSSPDILFQPCGFSPLRWLSPPFDLQVCCTLLPILGFVSFQHTAACPFTSLDPFGFLGGFRDDVDGFPATRLTPRRTSPFCSRTVSPRPCPFLVFPLESFDLSLPDHCCSGRYLSLRSRAPPSRCCSAWGAVPSHAVFGRTWPVLPGFRSPSRPFGPNFCGEAWFGWTAPARQGSLSRFMTFRRSCRAGFAPIPS